jgi:hypothetical protein
MIMNPILYYSSVFWTLIILVWNHAFDVPRQFWWMDVVVYALVTTSLLNHGWTSRVFQWLDRGMAAFAAVAEVYAHIQIRDGWASPKDELWLHVNCACHVLVVWFFFVMPRLMRASDRTRTLLHLLVHADVLTYFYLSSVYQRILLAKIKI